MKVKINNKIYDSEETPIMIILTEKDKENISNMRKQDTKYCSFPDNMNEDEILKWMREGVQ